MSQSARVTSIDALREWKEALVSFRADAQEALIATDLEIRRFFDWLDQQIKFWQAEVRRREDLLQQAKSDLLRKQLRTTPTGREPDTTDEKKAVRRAQERLRNAEEKVERARQLGPELRRAAEEYQTPARRLAGVLDSDLPQALALLEQKLAALDAYIGMAPPRPKEPAP
jgi:hypothetical protein